MPPLPDVDLLNSGYAVDKADTLCVQTGCRWQRYGLVEAV